MNLEIKSIKGAYFSGTGTTKKIVDYMGDRLSREIFGTLSGSVSFSEIDFTPVKMRNEILKYNVGDLVIIGVPVYAGRVPNVLLKFLNQLEGKGAMAVPVVVFGNRDYDDALVELRDILLDRGFQVVAGAAFVGEHSFSTNLGANRPDKDDLAVADDFVVRLAQGLLDHSFDCEVSMKGCIPYRPYYRPKNKNGESVDIRRVKPKTNGDCTDCKVCVALCPMGSIDFDDVGLVNGICIKCGACIKGCPVQSKYYDDADYLRHKEELEVDFQVRREPEVFL